MAFLDRDPVEDHLGKAVDEMAPDELAAYFSLYLRARHGTAPPMDGVKERSIFRALQRFYGQREAGHIVKWACWRYDGKWRGGFLSYGSFSKKMRWLTDIFLMESHDHLRRTSYTKPSTADALGFAVGGDVL